MSNPVGQWVSVKKSGLPVLEKTAGEKYYQIRCEFISKLSSITFKGYLEYKRDKNGDYKPLRWFSDDARGGMEIDTADVIAWLILPLKPDLIRVADSNGVYYALVEDISGSA